MLNGLIGFVFALEILLAGWSGAFEHHVIRNTLGQRCLEPCVINYNRGGFPLRYAYVAYLIRRGARAQVVINGHCLSSCAIFANLVRPKACVTTDGVFGFHKGWPNFYEFGIPLRLKYKWIEAMFVSNGVYGWLVEHDAFLGDDWKGMLYMPQSDAVAFWPTCSQAITSAIQASPHS